MKTSYFPKLAVTGISKNKKLYLPYIFASVGMVMMYYIIDSLSRSQLLNYMKGGTSLIAVLSLGKFVIAVFALIFLFYTNSFLIRRRNKEFGLYNILGMDKRSIGKIIAYESLIVSFISLIAGTLLGILFSKLCELGLIEAIHGKVDYSFTISTDSIIYTLMIFGIIFILLYLVARLRVHKLSPLDLFHSENAGEKPPKANFVIAILGLFFLGGAYAISASVKTPLKAITLFFIAVIMVIIGTYMLFIAGSVTLCRLLQKRKKYYYKANHFVSVSSMAYRMKRNGAGLASICILITMVLVMISSTTSLFLGEEDCLSTIYPKDIITWVQTNSETDISQMDFDLLKDDIDSTVKEYNAPQKDLSDCITASTFGIFEKGNLSISASNFSNSDITGVYVVSLKDYNKSTGKNETLKPDEALVYNDKANIGSNVITIAGAKPVKVKKYIEKFSGDTSSISLMYSSVYIVVDDYSSYIKPLLTIKDGGENVLTQRWNYSFNTADNDELQEKMSNEISENFYKNKFFKTDTQLMFNIDCISRNRSEFYSLYGGLFFLGIILSIVFIFAAVLIIYYKQISEGYEDRSRFEIMQKVGMTKREIRKTVNSQVLTVFFLPIIFAGLNLGFAFPMIWKCLQLFNLNNLTFTIIVSVGVFLLFALIYMLIYKVTSNAYFKIVNRDKD